MGGNKRQKTRNGRKGQKRNKQRAGARPQTFGSQPLLPASRRVALAYAERVNIFEAVANAGAITSFSLNSLFDPNSGGIGTQPVGFDQISAMYGQYRVWSVKVRVSYNNTSAANTAIFGSMFGTFQPAAPSNPDAWVCQPYGCSGIIDPIGGRSTKTFVKSFDIPTVLGLTKSQYQNDMDFVGTPSGNPTRQAYLMVGLRGLAGTVGSAFVYVQIEYLTEFSQPAAMSLS